MSDDSRNILIVGVVLAVAIVLLAAAVAVLYYFPKSGSGSGGSSLGSTPVTVPQGGTGTANLGEFFFIIAENL